jgi:hypothetical protein
MLSLAERPLIRSRFADLAIASGMSDPVARKVADLCRAGVLDAKCLERWRFSGILPQIGESTLLELVDLQLVEGRPDLWSNAVHMFHAYYLGKDRQQRLPEDATYRLLTWPAMGSEAVSHAVSYYWSRLAAAFLLQYATRNWELFKAALRLGMKQWDLLEDLDTCEGPVLAGLFISDPERAWECIAEVVSDQGADRAFGIQHWLADRGRRLVGDDSPGLLQFAPPVRVFAWVDECVEERGRWLISALPKTLDQSPAGRLTREFLVRYGKDPSLANALWCHFTSRGWCGSASARYRQLREEARAWLAGEKNQTVIRWVENYIDGLGCDIQQAEIEEERQG